MSEIAVEEMSFEQAMAELDVTSAVDEGISNSLNLRAGTAHTVSILLVNVTVKQNFCIGSFIELSQIVP